MPYSSIANEIERHLPAQGESRRLFHGRGGTFAGYEDLVIDAFPPVVMIILYRVRNDDWLKGLAALLLTRVPGCTAILLQERWIRGAPSRMLAGELPQEHDALENGLRFRLRLGDAQNIGFFLDMGRGRAMARSLAAGRKVLNLYAYSCSFSLAALAGGARQVTNVDMYRPSLELGRFNHQLNGLDPRGATFLCLDVFKSWGKLRRLGPFDLIIVDPPATQGKSFDAERDWPKLIRNLPPLLAPGGEIIACLCSPRMNPASLDARFAEQAPALNHIETLDRGEDFPEVDIARGVTIHRYRMELG